MVGFYPFHDGRSPFEYWEENSDRTQDFWQGVTHYRRTLQTWQTHLKKSRLLVVIREQNPFAFLTCTLAALQENHAIFFTNPQWQRREWQQFSVQVTGDLWLENQVLHPGDRPPAPALPLPSPHHGHLPDLPEGQPWIMIPTGGSSGRLKLAIHNPETLTAAVHGLQQYLSLPKISSFCCLPLFHVSGFMQFWRSLITGGSLQIFPYGQLKQGHFPPISPGFCLSLVPTQLRSLLSLNAPWLRQFSLIFIGGAAGDQRLWAQGRQARLNLALCYGMTETAAQVVTLKPEDFLQGNQSCGQVLPHGQIRIHQQELVITSESLFWGYYPHCQRQKSFKTGDLGQFKQNFLYLQGRAQRCIISGGENLNPQEIEGVIFATGWVKDAVVFGVSDRHWGEKVAVAYVLKNPKNQEAMETQLKQYLKSQLAPHKIPKSWHLLPEIPRNSMGKVNLMALAEKFKTP